MRTMTAIGLAVVLSLIGGVVLGTVGTLALLLVDWAVASRRPEDALNPGGGWTSRGLKRTDWTGNRHPTCPKGATIVQIDAHNMDREQRRALLEQRRSAVAHQLRRLAIELTDIDRQLDEIEQSEAEARHPRSRAT